MSSSTRKDTRDGCLSPASTVLAIGRGPGVGAGPGSWASLRAITPATRRRVDGGPGRRPVPARDRAGRPVDRGNPARAGPRGRRRATQARAVVPRPAGRAIPRGHPQHQAASRRLQVPRGDGHQLRPPARPDRRGATIACCRCSGRSTTSRTRRPRTSRKATGRSARSTKRACPGPARPRAEFLKRDGALGRRRGRRRRRRPLPDRGRGRDDGAALADGRARPAQHRPQADLRRAELADLAGDRLAARRARAPLARLRPARPPRRLAATSPSGLTKPTSRTPRRSATTGRSASPTPAPPAPCSRRSARPAPRTPRPRPSKLLEPGRRAGLALGRRRPLGRANC